MCYLESGIVYFRGVGGRPTSSLDGGGLGMIWHGMTL